MNRLLMTQLAKDSKNFGEFMKNLIRTKALRTAQGFGVKDHKILTGYGLFATLSYEMVYKVSTTVQVLAKWWGIDLETGRVKQVEDELWEALDKAMAQTLGLKAEIVRQIKKMVTRTVAEQEKLRSFYYGVKGKELEEKEMKEVLGKHVGKKFFRRLGRSLRIQRTGL